MIVCVASIIVKSSHIMSTTYCHALLWHRPTELWLLYYGVLLGLYYFIIEDSYGHFSFSRYGRISLLPSGTDVLRIGINIIGTLLWCTIDVHPLHLECAKVWQ